MKYGYARVPPGGKSESIEAQTRQLIKAGCKKVFRDVHVSGAKTDRAQLRRVIDHLEAGDVLMVTRLDRLARSIRDLLNTLAVIADRKAALRGGKRGVYGRPSNPAANRACGQSCRSSSTVHDHHTPAAVHPSRSDWAGVRKPLTIADPAG